MIEITGWIIANSLLALLLTGVAARRAYRRIEALRLKLIESEKLRREISHFLSRFSSGISSEDGVDGAMHAAALYVAEQIDAETVAIYSVRGDKLICGGVFGRYPLLPDADPEIFTNPARLLDALRRSPPPAGSGFPGGLIATDRPELIPDAAADPRFAAYRLPTGTSVMALPMHRDDGSAGVICAVGNKLSPRHSFGNEQLDRFRLLASQVLMVQNLVDVYDKISRRNRIDQELQFARQLQQSLLPKKFPEWGKFSIAARTRSAKEVNGDFYDFVRIDEDRMLVLIGDACGKGIPACMLTAMTRSFARSLTDNFTTLTNFLRDVNDKINRDTETDRFITLGCCLLDRRNMLLEFGRAGHTDLISFVHQHIRVFSPDGTALGILPGDMASFETICVAIEPETTLMMFSDGLSEALNHNDEEFGVPRLIEAFREACCNSSDPDRIISEIMGRVASYESGQNDDQTIVLIRHAGQPPEPDAGTS